MSQHSRSPSNGVKIGMVAKLVAPVRASLEDDILSLLVR